MIEHQIWHWAGSTLEVYRQGWSPQDNCGMEPCGESLGNNSACRGKLSRLSMLCMSVWWVRVGSAWFSMVQYFHFNFWCFKTICQTFPWRNHIWDFGHGQKCFPTIFRLTHMFPKGQRILWQFCFLQYVLIGLHLDHHVLPAILD